MIDEFGAEKNKNASEFMNSEITRIVKDRIDNQMPVLIATNMDVGALERSYGATIASMLQLNETVYMAPGDYRGELAKKMKKDMGFGT